MKAQINTLNTYFCYDAYSTAGRPKMEEALYDIARRNVLHHTIQGSVVDNLLEDLAHAQEHQKALHRNWKPVEISLYGGSDGLFWLNIGESNLRFREIRGEWQEQPEVNLEKEIDEYFALWRQGASDEGCFNANSQLVSIYDCYRIAHHFYKLSRNARKEGSALTKDDVRRIFDLVRELQTKYSATDGCLQEVADIFNKEREKGIVL